MPIFIDDLDYESNPYYEIPDTPNLKSLDTDELKKVWFGHWTHKYYLADSNGFYGKKIVSASWLLQFWREFKKDGSSENFDLTFSAVKEQRSRGMFVRPGTFKPHCLKLRELLINYVNTVKNIAEPLESQERRNLLSASVNGNPILFSLLFRESDLIKFEEWIISGCNSLPIEQLPRSILVLLRFGKGHFNDSLFDVEAEEAGEKEYLLLIARTPSQFGTDLHANLEASFIAIQNGNYDRDIVDQKFPLPSNWDYAQAHKYIDDMVESEQSPVMMELRLASFRSKICGAMDALHFDPSEGYIVYDYKRTAKFNDEPWFVKGGVCSPDLSIINRKSSELFKYAVQLAILRKLLIQNGYHPVSEMTRLQVFHPTLNHYSTINIRLSDQIEDRRLFFKFRVEFTLVELIDHIFLTLEKSHISFFASH